MGLLSFFRKVLPQPEPAFDAVPSFENRGYGMDVLINLLGVNEETPKPGDVVAHLVTCGMGVSVIRDTRWRVVGPGPYPKSVEVVSEEGKKDILHSFYMRRHTKVPRFWMLFD